MPERVVVTGLGVVSPLGLSARAHYAAACAGQSGIRPIQGFDIAGLRSSFGGQVDNEGLATALGPTDTRLMDRFSQLAVVAARAALADAGLEADRDVSSQRLATCVGSGMGGRITDEEVLGNYFTSGGKTVSSSGMPMIMASAATAWVAISCNARGPSLPISSACASGSQSIGLGTLLLRSGAADAVLAGGADAGVIRTVLLGWGVARAVTRLNDPTASRPFDASRDGFVLAEGAAVLLLETESRARSRGARVYAEVRGVGNSADAWDITAPSYSGEGAVRAMRAALDDAGAQPDDIGLVSAHGTSTRLNDITEAKAIRAVFGEGERPDVMSLKALTGHAMGASGAIEAATVCMVFKEGWIPPNPHLANVDADCRLNHVRAVATPFKGGMAVANSFGFGGVNSCLVLAPCS